MPRSEIEIVQDFSNSTSAYFSDRIEHESVHVLLISWNDNDLKPEKEIDALHRLFEESFNFSVTRFPIPSKGGQLRLNRDVSDFVSRFADRENTLVIIYYAGHCYKGLKGEARWAAFERGEPTLSWSACQQNLYGAIGDVILILDCCNAALLAKGTKDEGRFEVLAASAKGVLTPEPGKYSFTAFLLRELRGHIEAGITVRELAGILLENDRITETPYYVDLARTSATSTRIKKLKDATAVRFTRKPVGYLMFRASLTDDLTGRQIAEWLKTAPPDSVTAVNIEAVVLRARRLQDNLSNEAFPPGSLLGKLPLAEQQKILKELQGLNTTMSATADLAQDPLMQADEQSIGDAFQSMKYRVSALSDAVQTSVLLDLDSKDVAIGPTDQQIMDATETTEAVSLRSSLASEQAITESLELDFHSIRDLDSSKRFGTGRLKNRQVLAEFFDYFEDPETGEPYDETVQQLTKMTGVLCHSKRPSYHILPCVGYAHDKFAHKFGLIFEPPLFSNLENGPKMLHQIFDAEPVVPLGHRVRLAHALSAALESFHRVGWVHKEIRSDNLAFMPLATIPDAGIPGPRALAGAVDLAAPWLFGFEYARAEAAGTRREEDHSLDNNLYRHPDRWGKPRVDFTKAHDVYSLGIVLYEIAIWKSIKAILKLQDRQRIPSDFVRSHVEKACKKRLPHQVGTAFTDAILVCVGFGQRTQGMSALQAQTLFQTQVSQKLDKIAGSI